MTSVNTATSNAPDTAPVPAADPLVNTDNRGLALVTYGLFAAGQIFWPAAIIGVIIAYIKRGDASGTVYASHYPWLIRAFWVSFFLGLAGLILTVTYIGAVIGIPLIIAAWIYSLYKIIKGGLRVLEGRPVP